MSKTTVNNSMGSASVQLNADGSLCLSIDSHTDGPALINLTSEYAAIIGRALTGTPAPFLEDARFEDVQVGDRVRITWKDGDVIECTVGKATGYRIDSESGDVAVVERDNDSAITILSRPTRQLPTEPRSVILVEVEGESVPMILDADGDWAAFAESGREGYWSSDDIAALPWKLAKVVEA